MAKDGDDLDSIRKKLKSFEANLQDLLKATKEDLDIAEQLQKFLMPNRLPEIPGMQCLARYIPAHQISCEGFDIIPTKDGRQLWIVSSWTESFGLSSLLLQAMVHLQSKAMVESRPQLSASEVFNDLSLSLSEAKKAAGYRLMTARIEISSLSVNGVSIGSVPPLKRASNRNQLEPWAFVNPEAFATNPTLFEAANSSAPTLAENAYHFAFTLEPGSRLCLLSTEWNKEARKLSDFAMPLSLARAKSDATLLEDLNHILMNAEAHTKRISEQRDLSAIVLEVDRKKLHLA